LLWGQKSVAERLTSHCQVQIKARSDVARLLVC
jgi:hypothetical protein